MVNGKANRQLLEERNNYFALKIELQDQFETPDCDHELIREVVACKQLSSELFEDYYVEIHDFTFKTKNKIQEQELINFIKSNIKPIELKKSITKKGQKSRLVNETVRPTRRKDDSKSESLETFK